MMRKSQNGGLCAPRTKDREEVLRASAVGRGGEKRKPGRGEAGRKASRQARAPVMKEAKRGERDLLQQEQQILSLLLLSPLPLIAGPG